MVAIQTSFPKVGRSRVLSRPGSGVKHGRAVSTATRGGRTVRTMRITVFGSTGRIGSAVVAEAHARGHEVTAVVHRRPAEVPEGVTAQTVDLADQDQVRAACADRDVVVSAIGWTPEQPDDLLGWAARALLEAVRGTDTRLLIVGGAGTLLTDTGLYVDSPTFPPERRRNS